GSARDAGQTAHGSEFQPGHGPVPGLPAVAIGPAMPSARRPGASVAALAASRLGSGVYPGARARLGGCSSPTGPATALGVLGQVLALLRRRGERAAHSGWARARSRG